MMTTLVIYNNHIQTAKWANFGHKVVQDGDIHTIMFEEAGDAAKFCLQVRYLARGRMSVVDSFFPSRP